MSLRNYRELNKLVDRISTSIQQGHVSHAYIIEGDRCIDKETFAKDFAKAVLCTCDPGFGCDRCATCRKIDHGNYEDLYMVCADDLSLKDAQISALQENLKNRPTGGMRNIAIVADADTMTKRAQNRLLKTLEEPGAGTVILLLSENTDSLLETIRSRCIIYRPGNFLQSTENLKIEAAEEIMTCIAEGAYFCDLKDRLSKLVKDRKEAFLLLDGLERLFRQYLTDDGPGMFRRERIIENVKYIEEARRDLLANVNYKYAIRNLILKIGG